MSALFFHRLLFSIVVFSCAGSQTWAADAEGASPAISEAEREVRLQEYLREREEEEKRLLEAPIATEEGNPQNLVEVESNNVLPSDVATSYALVPYKIRRPQWGHMFSVVYSQYNPLNYQTDYLNPQDGTFEELYGSAQTPLIELSYVYKRNFVLGSLGLEAAYGFYANESQDDILGDAKLNLQMGRVGLRYAADALFNEPRVVPYGIAGAYTVLYKEARDNATFDGSTAVAYYYGGGAMLQLGWMDPAAAVDGYLETGVENTYIFLELRKYTASSEERDPDFSTDFDINGGLSLEF